MAVQHGLGHLQHRDCDGWFSRNMCPPTQREVSITKWSVADFDIDEALLKAQFFLQICISSIALKFMRFYWYQAVQK